MRHRHIAHGEIQVDLCKFIREIPDFPKPGISFKDITTLLKDKEAFRALVRGLAEPFRTKDVDIVVSAEARGFAIGAPVAYELGAGFVLARKPGKLPGATERYEYTLEYGTDAQEIHRDAIIPGQRVLIVDDVLATGGTVGATVELVRKLQGEIVGIAFLLEIAALNGRKQLQDYEVVTLLQY